MRAAINTRYGAPDVLSLGEAERPTLREHQVLVEVHASAVTQGDRRLRAADFPGISAVFGRLLIGVLGPRQPVGGSAFAGRVVEVGRSVTRFAVGDEVFGSHAFGVQGSGYTAHLLCQSVVGKVDSAPSEVTEDMLTDLYLLDDDYLLDDAAGRHRSP